MTEQERAWRAEFDKTGRTLVRDYMNQWPEIKAKLARDWLSGQDRCDRRTAMTANIAAIIAATAAIITLILMAVSMVK